MCVFTLLQWLWVGAEFSRIIQGYIIIGELIDKSLEQENVLKSIYTKFYQWKGIKLTIFYTPMLDKKSTL